MQYKSILLLASVLLLTNISLSQLIDTSLESIPPSSFGQLSFGNISSFGSVVTWNNYPVTDPARGVVAALNVVYIVELGADNAITPIQYINNSNANNRFGEAVAFDNDLVVIGAPGVSSSSGAVYVYTKNESGLYVLTQTLLPPTTSGQFGAYISARNGYLLVGSSASTLLPVYVFRLNDTNFYVADGNITYAGNDSPIQFGHCLSFDGVDRIVVGAQTSNWAGVYKRTGNSTWSFQEQLDPVGLTPIDGSDSTVSYGWACDIYTDSEISRIVVSGYGQKYGGSVWIYDRTDAGNYSNTKILNPVISEFEPTFTNENHQFGYSLALYDDKLVVGMLKYPDVTAQAYGAAYYFQYNPADQKWVPLSRLLSVDSLNASANFGQSVALNPDGFALVGAPGQSPGGSVFVFDTKTVPLPIPPAPIPEPIPEPEPVPSPSTTSGSATSTSTTTGSTTSSTTGSTTSTSTTSGSTTSTSTTSGSATSTTGTTTSTTSLSTTTSHVSPDSGNGNVISTSFVFILSLVLLVIIM